MCRFVSSVWRVLISSQKYIVIRFLVMTNDFADHTGQYFHESKSKLEIKRYGRNSTIRVWVIYFIYILWNNLKQQPVLGVVSPEKRNWTSDRVTVILFRLSDLITFKEKPLYRSYILSKYFFRHYHSFSLVVKHRKSVQFGNIQSHTRACS